MKLNVFAMLLLAVTLVAISGCSELYNFEGMVVDGDGNPVSGALILLHPADWPEENKLYRPEGPHVPGSSNVSDLDGTFVATWGCAIDVEVFRMTVLRDGYKESERVVILANTKDIRVVLEREPEVESQSDRPVDAG